MPAVIINPGKYYVGNPLTVFPDWTPLDSCTYEVDGVTFHAFPFGDVFVAAIPIKLVDSKLRKSLGTSTVTFTGPTVFQETHGIGSIGDIAL